MARVRSSFGLLLKHRHVTRKLPDGTQMTPGYCAQACFMLDARV